MNKASASRGNRMVAEYQKYIDQLAPGKAGRLQASEGETLRALTLRLRRAAKLAGKTLKIHKTGDELLSIALGILHLYDRPRIRLFTRQDPFDRFVSVLCFIPREKFDASVRERIGQIVRQSSNARWVSLLAVIIVVLFVILYYFYELGAPLGLSKPRLEQQTELQQVTAVEAGYNLYIASTPNSIYAS